MYEGTENLYEVGYKKVEMAVETRQKRWQYQYMLMARGEISPSPCRKNCRQLITAEAQLSARGSPSPMLSDHLRNTNEISFLKESDSDCRWGPGHKTHIFCKEDLKLTPGLGFKNRRVRFNTAML